MITERNTNPHDVLLVLAESDDKEIVGIIRVRAAALSAAIGTMSTIEMSQTVTEAIIRRAEAFEDFIAKPEERCANDTMN